MGFQPICGPRDPLPCTFLCFLALTHPLSPRRGLLSIWLVESDALGYFRRALGPRLSDPRKLKYKCRELKTYLIPFITNPWFFLFDFPLTLHPFEGILKKTLGKIQMCVIVPFTLVGYRLLLWLINLKNAHLYNFLHLWQLCDELGNQMNWCLLAIVIDKNNNTS